MAKFELTITDIEKWVSRTFDMTDEVARDEADEYASDLSLRTEYEISVAYDHPYHWIGKRVKGYWEVHQITDELRKFESLNLVEALMYKTFIVTSGLSPEELFQVIDEGRAVRLYRQGLPFEERFGKWILTEVNPSIYRDFMNDKPSEIVIDYERSGERLVQKYVIDHFEHGNSFYLIWE